MSDEQRIRPGDFLAEQIRVNRAIPLGRYLRGLAHASAFASVLAAGACSGPSTNADVPPTGEPGSPNPSGENDDGSEFEVPEELTVWIDPATAIPPECDDFAQWRGTQGLDPAVTDYDYIAVTACDTICLGTDTDGTPCVTDDDPSECEQEVESFLNGGRPPTVITTRGTEVVKYQSKERLMDFLGEVNTPQEALLVAFFNWFSVGCADLQFGAVRLATDGYDVVVTQTTRLCTPIVDSRFLLHVGSDGELTELDSEAYSVDYGFCIGRRPEGLQTPSAAATHETEAAAYFANIAALEAAAVVAFERLADDLAALGAPAALVSDARDAADEEARHAEIMGKVARRFGAEPEPPSVAPPEPRSPYAIALENGVEGCVRETFGALSGCYQGLAARDPVVASAMREVSEDEIRHAELSHRVDAFLQSLLSPDDRARLASAKQRAIADLRKEIAASAQSSVSTIAGHPDPALAARWVDRLERDLWS